METALNDSQYYQILSPEEVDELKKRLAVVSSKIDTTKKKLALETKLRDAAQSINKLNKAHEASRDRVSAPARKHSRNFLGSKSGSVDFSASNVSAKAEADFQESVKKCEDLKQEVWQLEHWERELQTTLLEHTAGILQMTHGETTESRKGSDPYSYHDGMQGNLGNNLGAFGGNSQYAPYAGIDNTLDYFNSQGGKDSEDYRKQTQLIADVENKVEDLNYRLRDIIAEMKLSQDFPEPPRLEDNLEAVGGVLWEQVSYAEKGLDLLQNATNSAEQTNTNLQAVIDERLEGINNRLADIMNRSSLGLDWKYTPPAMVAGKTLQEKMGYLRDALNAVDQRVQQLAEYSESSLERLVLYDKTAQQYDTTMRGLWDTLLLTEVEAKNPDGGRPSEILQVEYTLQAYISKFEDFCRLAINLAREREDMVRDMEQQSEMHKKTREVDFAGLNSELVEVRKQMESMDLESKGQKEELASTIGKLAEATAALSSLEQQKEKNETEALLAERTRVAQLETALQQMKEESSATGELQSKLTQAEQALQRLTSQLEESKASSDVMSLNVMTLRSDLEEQTSIASQSQAQVKDQESEIVRIQTELTFAKAELDSAYGSRAQRAAENDQALQKDLSELQERNVSLVAEMTDLRAKHDAGAKAGAESEAKAAMLQREIADVIGDYEEMTKASVEFEREREGLERTIDGLREKVESLEGQIQEEKVQALGSAKSPSMQTGTNGVRDSMASLAPGGGASTSASVLRTEFKKIMRETRAEHSKALRVSSFFQALISCIKWSRADSSNTG